MSISTLMTATLALLMLACVIAGEARAQVDQGWQTIRGTRVFTVIDHTRRSFTFRNQCGTQTLTHLQVQAGAIPNRIIPCPRPTQNTLDSAASPQRGYYGAIATAIYDRGRKVATGVSWNHATREQARAAAVRECAVAGGIGCVARGNGFSNGGCGYVSIGKRSGQGVCWATGSTAAAAVTACTSQGCSCNPARGGCTRRP
jgi:hypothetical protein